VNEGLQQEDGDKKRRCGGALQQCRMIGVNSWVEDGIAETTEHGCDQTDWPEDFPDQRSIGRPEQHPSHACGGETVADQLRRGGEGCQEQRYPGRMQQQEVLVRKQAVDQPDG
jgi:hypothetical protein